jgi:HlyD family secretion protein
MKRPPLIVLVLLLVAGGIGAFLVLAPRFDETASLSGYVEGEALYPASPLAGRLVGMSVQRGQDVTEGAQLFAIDPAQGASQRDQALAELAAAKALATDARIGARRVELGVIEAQLEAARARLKESTQQLDRIRPLVEAGAAPRAQLDTAIAARDTSAANVTAIEKQLSAARLGQRDLQVAAAQDRVRQAQAAVDASEARLKDLTPVAPSAGRIEDVYFQPGEWVPANQPVLALLPFDRVRIRFYVPQAEVMHYAIGKEVRFGCDGCPDGLSALINFVSPRPEFTPPVIYSRDARDRLVFLVEAQPKGEARLTPGLPVDVQPLASAP